MKNRPPLEQAFADGVVAGITVTLDQLDGQSALSTEGVYHGPVPAELRNWIEAVRKRIGKDS